MIIKATRNASLAATDTRCLRWIRLLIVLLHILRLVEYLVCNSVSLRGFDVDGGQYFFARNL